MQSLTLEEAISLHQHIPLRRTHEVKKGSVRLPPQLETKAQTVAEYEAEPETTAPTQKGAKDQAVDHELEHPGVKKQQSLTVSPRAPFPGNWRDISI